MLTALLIAVSCWMAGALALVMVVCNGGARSIPIIPEAGDREH